MKELQGKIALVTGVGRKEGIGAAICRKLATEGADVFFTFWHAYDESLYPDTKGEVQSMFVEELKQHGVRAACAEVDLSAADSAEKLFALVKNELGSPDILVNNACYSTRQSFSEITADLLDKHYQINVRAVLLLCKEFVKNWSKDKGGRIVNMDSGQSLGVMREELPYTVTKAGLEMLTIQLAPELATRGITINAINPGPTDTGWITEDIKKDIGKVNMPSDAADTIFSLLGENAENTTGQVIHAKQ